MKFPEKDPKVDIAMNEFISNSRQIDELEKTLKSRMHLIEGISNYSRNTPLR